MSWWGGKARAGETVNTNNATLWHRRRWLAAVANLLGLLLPSHLLDRNSVRFARPGRPVPPERYP